MADETKKPSGADESPSGTRRGSAAKGSAAEVAPDKENASGDASTRRPAAKASPTPQAPSRRSSAPTSDPEVKGSGDDAAPAATPRVADAAPAVGAGGDAPVGLLSAMWRYKGMCVVIVVVCVLASTAIGFLLTPEPSATATIALKTPSQDNVLAPGSTGDASLARYTAQRARFVTSDAVLGNVGAVLGVDDLNELRDQLEVEPSTDSNIVTITASGTTSDDAVRLATEVTRAYGEETEKQVNDLTDAALRSIDESAGQVRATITGSNAAVNEAAASTLGQLQQKAATIRTSSAVLGDGVEFVVNPDESSVSSQQLPIREAALGLILGLVIAGTVAYLRADSDAAKQRRA
ncbi:MAG: hypothetical protein EKK62_07030 [Acidimicrobiia bacterium]|nr:hypothetical protein [Microthrixaceae bacterium]RTL08540.1 MAG: hypothetical protein EKK62_07030 [Acidimicrobiia bacterium]